AGIADVADVVAGDRAGRIQDLDAVLRDGGRGTAAGHRHAVDVHVRVVDHGGVLLEVRDRAAVHLEAEPRSARIVVDLQADAALHAAHILEAVARGAGHIRVAHAGDVDVDQASRGVAVDHADEIGLTRAAAFIDGVAAAGAVDVDIFERHADGL